MQVGDSLLQVRAWKIPPGTPLAHRPMPSQEIQIIVRNIGVGGLGITLACDSSEPPAALTDRLRLLVTHGQTEVLIEGRLRAPDANQAEHFVQTGIRFEGNQSNFGYQIARSAIFAIVGSVQREGLRARRIAEQLAKGDSSAT